MPKRFRSRSRATRRYKRVKYSMGRRARTRVRRSMRGRDVHRFCRWATNGTDDSAQGSWTQSVEGVTESINPVFKLNYLPNYTEFTNLYDQYKITTVVCHVQLVSNPDAGNILNSATAGNNSSNWYPKLWYVRDYDDSSSLTLDDMRQYAKAKMVVLRPNKTYRIACKPAILMQAYDTAISTAYIPKWNQWVDAASSGVPYYGLKFFVDCMNFDPADAAPFRVRFDVKYYVTMKTPR